MKIGNKDFTIGKKTFIMGILNITPDSFSDGGKYNTIELAVEQAKKMIEEGVDIIDIGGESTRPNHKIISIDEEIERVVPIIESIKYLNTPISIDTSKSEVAIAAMEAGANMVNDIWGLKKDSKMAHIIAKYNLPCCIMHNRENNQYSNLIDDIIGDLQESLNIASNAGIRKENIILDPGIGFAKDLMQNIEVMNKLEAFKNLGYPLLLGISRKSMIGLSLNLSVDERLEGTIASNVIGIMKGCDFIRVHDVKENKRAAMMTDIILRR